MSGPDAPPTPPAPRRALRRGLFALIGVSVSIGAAMWLAIATEKGSAWLLMRAPQVTASQTTGRVFGGAFSAHRVEVRTGARTIVLDKLAWRDAHWAWRPHDGAWFGLVIEGASIERVQIGEATATSLAVEPKSLRLPFALAISGLHVGELQYETSSPLRDISASVELGHDAGREHRVPALTLRSDLATASGNARIGADAPFALEAQIQAASLQAQMQAASQGGAVRPWQASAKASGPLAAIAVSAQLTSPQAAGAQLDAEATLSPFAAWPLSQLRASTRALDLSALSAEAPQTLIAGEARIDTQGLDKPITASVKLSNAQAGRWDERRLPLADVELDIAGRADQRDRLTLRRFELRAPGDGGRATGQGEWKGSTATIDLTLHALRPALLDNRAPAMTLSGTFGSRWLGLPSPDGTAALASTLQLQSQLALAGKLDGKRGEAVRIDAGLQAQRSADGWRIELNDAQARAGAASLRGALQAERSSSGATQLKSQGQAQGFDPAQWWAAAPAARLNGTWKAELQAPPSWRFEARNAASWLALRGKTELDVQDSTLAGVPLQATLRADGAASGWSVDAKATAANNKATLQGLLAARADGDRWRADIDAPALTALRPLVAALAPRAGLDGVDGAATAELQASGRWPAARTAARCAPAACRRRLSVRRSSMRSGKPGPTAMRRCNSRSTANASPTARPRSTPCAPRSTARWPRTASTSTARVRCGHRRGPTRCSARTLPRRRQSRAARSSCAARAVGNPRATAQANGAPSSLNSTHAAAAQRKPGWLHAMPTCVWPSTHKDASPKRKPSPAAPPCSAPR